MKKIIGIVAEYNPFHDGHRFHIKKSREAAEKNVPEQSTRKAAEYQPTENNNDTLVICCMSGDFVQRGEWAILPKHERAAAAIRGGADLVTELPLPWCISSAEGFAEGAVSLLLRLGITHLSFGSECGRIGPLAEAAELFSLPGFQEEIAAEMKRNPTLSYPAARGRALKHASVCSGRMQTQEYDPDRDLSLLLEAPNNLLGTEYLKALKKFGVLPHFTGTGTPDADPEKLPGTPEGGIVPLTVRRSGSVHDGIHSAMELRKEMRERGEGAEDQILNLAAVSRLRALDRAAFDQFADTDNGAGDRLYDAIRAGGCTLEEICLRAKTKSLPLARMRRIALRAVLGIGRELTEDRLPPYARILAANEKGRAYLAENRKSSSTAGASETSETAKTAEAGRITVPLVILNRDLNVLDDFSRRVFAAGTQAGDFYNLGFREKRGLPCGEDCRLPPIML